MSEYTAIWKFQFPLLENFEIDMPEGGTIISVQVQNSQPCIWVIVKVMAPVVKRNFAITGTGWAFDPAEKIYVGTVQIDGLVWHLFEIKS